MANTIYASNKSVITNQNITCISTSSTSNKSSKCTNEKYINRVKSLYARHIRRHPSDIGKINVILSTNIDGKVNNVKVDTKIKSFKLKRIIQAVSKGVIFSGLNNKNTSFKYIFNAKK